MHSKYAEDTRKAINDYWREYHQPPTIREVMAMANIPTPSHAHMIIRGLPNIRIGKHGKPIPAWVDELFERGA